MVSKEKSIVFAGSLSDGINFELSNVVDACANISCAQLTWIADWCIGVTRPKKERIFVFILNEQAFLHNTLINVRFFLGVLCPSRL